MILKIYNAKRTKEDSTVLCYVLFLLVSKGSQCVRITTQRHIRKSFSPLIDQNPKRFSVLHSTVGPTVGKPPTELV